MARDKQLSAVELSRVLEKRRLDQALNAKEFAVLASISYSAAREWFRLPGFPVIRGVVFWSDFVEWRRRQTEVRRVDAETLVGIVQETPRQALDARILTSKASKILAAAS